MLGIYCRISKEKEKGKDRSIADQKAHGIALAKSLKMEYQLFIDEGISGTLPIDKRPALSELIDSVYQGSITTVYVYDQSRLERSLEARFAINKVFNEEGIDLYTDAGLVGKDIESDFAGDIMSVMNNFYVKITARKIRSVLARNAEKGKAHGILAYGYGKDENGFIEIDDEESQVVKEIYEMSLEGIGTKKIADILNAREVPTRYNKIGKGTLTTTDHLSKIQRTIAKKDIRWSGNTIRNIIVNPIYKGERHFSGSIYKAPKVFESNYWQKVNDNLSKNKKYSGKKMKYQYLLRGKIICARCERNYSGRKRLNNKDNFYMCSSKRINKNCGNRSINIDLIEDFIWERFFADGALRKQIEAYFQNTDIDKKIKELDEKIILLQKKISLTVKYESATRDYLIKGIFKEEDAMIDLVRLNKEKHGYTLELEDYSRNLFELTHLRDNNSGLVKSLDKIRFTTRFEDKRDIIGKYINAIRIDYVTDLKLYILEIDFNIAGLGNERYVIVKKLNLAHEIDKNILIGLNTKNKFIITMGNFAKRWQDQHEEIIRKTQKNIGLDS